MSFVCAPCKTGDHAACLGGTWCDCQHKQRPSMRVAPPAPIRISGPIRPRSVRTPGGGVVSDTGINVEARRKWHAEVPAFTGKHLWIIVSMWAVADPVRDQHILDLENLLTLDGPGCYWCEQPYRPTIGSKCPGDPRAKLPGEVDVCARASCGRSARQITGWTTVQTGKRGTQHSFAFCCKPCAETPGDEVTHDVLCRAENSSDTTNI